MKIDIRIWEIVLNPVAVSAVTAMATAQVFKAVQPLFRGKPIDVKRLTHYGGIPSAHSAFIVAAAAAVGFVQGWKSSLFAVSAVVASIIIYDILKMRRAVEIALEAAKQQAEKGKVKIEGKIPQFKAHTPVEVLAGVGWGIFWAWFVCWLYVR